MPLWRKFRIRPRHGRGGGYDGMVEQVIDQYDDMKKEFDTGSQAEKDAFIKALNDFDANEIGTNFLEGKDEFENACTDVLNFAKFFALLKNLGLDVELP